MRRLADNPQSESETDADALERAPLAAAFGRRVMQLDCSEGLVVGVLGPWGSGKTTFVNYARPQLKALSTALLDFNPWMFSGHEGLVESFFVELSAELRMEQAEKLSSIGDRLADYGESFAGLGWLPVVGPWIERGRGAGKVLGKYLSRRREGSGTRRERLEAELAKLKVPIVVVLDDIDRLSTEEIREIFKLIRLTASFPNVLYLVAFDRERVEKALAGNGIEGRDYLEKILQVAIDLPVLPAETLRAQASKAIEEAIAGSEVRELDPELWTNLMIEVIAPLLSNMRDVRRYATAVFLTVDGLGPDIALADLLAIEAVRTFMPDLYAELPQSVEALCTPGEVGTPSQDRGLQKDQIEKLINAAGIGREEIARAMIRHLFPFGLRHIENNHYGPDWERTFRRERRLAHKSVLSLYFERVLAPELAGEAEAEGAWARIKDADALERYLRAVPDERREETITALEGYEDEFASEMAVPAATALLNVGVDLPERPRAMLGLNASLIVGRVVVRLLRVIEGQDEVARVANQIFNGLRTLTAKYELLRIAGVAEESERKMLSTDYAEALGERFSEDVAATPAAALVGERKLARVIYRARLYADSEAPPIEIPADPEVTLTMLRSTRSEQQSQTVGSYAVRRTPVFAWSTLVELYRTEEQLIERIEELKASEVEIPSDLAALIDKYLGGWRPRDFDDEDVEEIESPDGSREGDESSESDVGERS
ncbi:MAG TPA: P-loop NTPase fold protein [Solirubrobacterales bacterium]|nr:P-loop NTPase fold protein [Solirubrobacterales bacterium]